MPYLCSPVPRERVFEIAKNFAEIAQLVEHDLAKVGVASSSLVFRSPFCKYALQRAVGHISFLQQPQKSAQNLLFYTYVTPKSLVLGQKDGVSWRFRTISPRLYLAKGSDYDKTRHKSQGYQVYIFVRVLYICDMRTIFITSVAVFLFWVVPTSCTKYQLEQERRPELYASAYDFEYRVSANNYLIWFPWRTTAFLKRRSGRR